MAASVGYVRAASNNAKGHCVGVARLIVGAGRGQVVKYEDGDTTNLRRENLWVGRGAAKRCDAKVIVAREGPASSFPTPFSPTRAEEHRLLG